VDGKKARERRCSEIEGGLRYSTGVCPIMDARKEEKTFGGRGFAGCKRKPAEALISPEGTENMTDFLRDFSEKGSLDRRGKDCSSDV